MSNTSTAVKAGLLTAGVFVASAMLLASSLKTTQPQYSYDAAVQHTASTSQPVEVVTVVATRRAS
jgi:hypothetical protein